MACSKAAKANAARSKAGIDGATFMDSVTITTPAVPITTPTVPITTPAVQRSDGGQGDAGGEDCVRDGACDEGLGSVHARDRETEAEVKEGTSAGAEARGRSSAGAEARERSSAGAEARGRTRPAPRLIRPNLAASMVLVMTRSFARAMDRAADAQEALR